MFILIFIFLCFFLFLIFHGCFRFYLYAIFFSYKNSINFIFTQFFSFKNNNKLKEDHVSLEEKRRSMCEMETIESCLKCI